MNATDLLKVLSAMKAEMEQLESQKKPLLDDMPEGWYEQLHELTKRAIIIRFTYEDLFRLYQDDLKSVSFVTPTL